MESSNPQSSDKCNCSIQAACIHVALLCTPGGALTANWCCPAVGETKCQSLLDLVINNGQLYALTAAIYVSFGAPFVLLAGAIPTTSRP